MTYYCKGENCEENSWSEEFEGGLCDSCWTKAQERKHNYWRGFIVGVIVSVVAFVILANIIIAVNK